MRLRLVYICLAIGFAGCSSSSNSSAVPASDFFIPARAADRATQSGIGVAREAVTQGDGPNGAHIIFLNFDGATLSHPSGYDDSAQNKSELVASGSKTMPAFDASPYAPAYTKQTAVAAITNYMTQFYAPFNAQIVNTRPSTGRYTMCVVGGTPQTLLGSSGTGAAGIAPLDCGNVNEPDVVYAFSTVIDPSQTGSAAESLKAIAVTCAQETAHSFGLGHTQNHMDIMYPQLDPAQTAFEGLSNIQPDGSGMCGNGTNQNSAQMLTSVIGAATTTSAVISVAFVTPIDQSTVPRDFTIQISASVAGGGTIDHVDLSLGQGQTTPYSLTTSPYLKNILNAPAGDYILTATAYDAQSNFQSASVEITVSANAPPQVLGCNVDSDCNSPLKCIDSMCVMSTATADMASSGCTKDGGCASTTDGGTGSDMQSSGGALGDSCTDGSQCQTGLCLVGPNQCTSSCDPSIASACPANYACTQNGGAYYCLPDANSQAGCSATGRGGPSTWWALCFVGLLIVRRRRRHRQSLG